MPTTPTPVADPFAGLSGIFDKVIGSNTKTKDDTNLQIQNLLDQLTKSSGATNSATTGATTQQSSTDQLQQLLSSVAGNVNTNTNQTQTTSADTSQLQKVFGQQQSGITPEALAAIFSEGQKQVPQLVSTYANALGARSDNNGPLASALRDLSTNLTNSAATQSQGLLNASGNTANQIAELSKSISTAGNTGQTSAQTTNTNNNVGTDVTGGTTTNQNVAGTSQNTTDANTVQNQTQNKQDNSTQTVGINTGQVGIAAGLAGLASLLGGGTGANSGLGGLLGGIKNLFTGGTTPNGNQTNSDPNAPVVGTPGNPGPDPTLPGPGDSPGNSGTTPDPAPPPPAPAPDNSGSDNPPPPDGGFADGGLIPMKGKLHEGKRGSGYADGGTVANPAGILQPQQGGLSVNTPGIKSPSLVDILNQSNIGGAGSGGSVNLGGVLDSISGGNSNVGAGLLGGIDQAINSPGGPGGGTGGVGTGPGTSSTGNNSGLATVDNPDNSIADGQTTTTGPGISANQGLNAAVAIGTMNPIGIAQAVMSIAQTMSNQSTTVGANPSSPAAMNAASVASQTDTDPGVNGSVADAAPADNADNGVSSDNGNGNGSTSGDTGDSGGDSGTSGYADGGIVSDQRIEPKVGTKSPVRTSGAGPMSVSAIAAAQAGASNPASAAAQTKLRANFLMNPKAIVEGQISDAEDGKPGYADGGNVTPPGVADNFSINVSGGEYMMPKDVVDVLGAPFFDAIRNAYHVPAVTQKAHAENSPNSMTPTQNIR